MCAVEIFVHNSASVACTDAVQLSSVVEQDSVTYQNVIWLPEKGIPDDVHQCFRRPLHTKLALVLVLSWLFLEGALAFQLQFNGFRESLISC